MERDILLRREDDDIDCEEEQDLDKEGTEHGRHGHEKFSLLNRKDARVEDDEESEEEVQDEVEIGSVGEIGRKKKNSRPQRNRRIKADA